MTQATEVPTWAPGARRALIVIAGSQLLALTLWFSASAVALQLETTWNLSTGQSAGLTLAVQIGFVAGALVSAVVNLADLVPSRRLFVVTSLSGAAMNAGLVWVDGERVWLAMTLRFLTGMALAGVYPSGLKVMAGWFSSARGMALGVLVGALTVGSAVPHLARGVGLDWQAVVLTASLLAVLAALAMAAGVGDGPYEVPTARFDPRQVGTVLRNRGVRLSTYGYLGHMWELYAMWTWTAAYLAASAADSGQVYPSTSTLTFAVIAIGGLGAWSFGRLADVRGRTLSAGSAMVVSGSMALITPLVFGASAWLVMAVFLPWGLTVVADSAQFSAMVTETAPDHLRGTALTLQTAVGFLLTLVTIRGVPLIADAVGWRWAFPVLALGPAVGTWAMVALKRSDWSHQLAGGRG